MRFNKRGVFFTSVVLVVVSIFVVSYTVYSSLDNTDSVQKRVDSMNNFVIASEEDLSRQIYVSGFRILFLMQKQIIETGDYLEVNSTFENAFFNGTINGVKNEEIESLMEGATFSGIRQSLESRASRINVLVNMTSPEIEVTQDDPWNVKIIFRSDLEINDVSGLASWDRRQEIVAYVPIEGFEDPIYPIESNNPAITVIINKSEFDSFNNSNELVTHAENTWYINTPISPSFLDRMEGNLNSQSPHGIESLAVPELSSKSDISIVDYEYFKNTPGSIPEISGLPNWFYIDSEHESIYSLNS